MWMRSWPTKPEIDEILTIEPPPAARIAGTACFMPRNTPLAFTFKRVSQADVLSVSGSNVPLMPALFTRMSSLPNTDTVVLTAASQSGSLVTSSFTNRAWPPDAAIFSTTWRASNSRTSATTTWAPSRAKIVASLCPIPLAPARASPRQPHRPLLSRSFAPREYRRVPPPCTLRVADASTPRSDHGHVRPRSRRVSRGLDLEARRRPPAGGRASGVRAEPRRLRRAPSSRAPGDQRGHSWAGDRAAHVLRGPRGSRARRHELGRHGYRKGGRAGARPHPPPRLRRRAGFDARRARGRHRQARVGERGHLDHHRPLA